MQWLGITIQSVFNEIWLLSQYIFYRLPFIWHQLCSPVPCFAILMNCATCICSVVPSDTKLYRQVNDQIKQVIHEYLNNIKFACSTLLLLIPYVSLFAPLLIF